MQIAGIILAGGRSSRMGQNKALMPFNGKPLVEHMVSILQNTGVDDIHISGQLDGYNCIVDNAPFAGPAKAIKSVVQKLPNYDGFLFIPVDMPLLKPDVLKLLLSSSNSSYFTNKPLPAFIKNNIFNTDETSVKELLKSINATAIELPQKFLPAMVNTNTPQQWQEATST